LHRQRLNAGTQRSSSQADWNREDAGGRHEIHQQCTTPTPTTAAATTTTTVSLSRFQRAKWASQVTIKKISQLELKNANV